MKRKLLLVKENTVPFLITAIFILCLLLCFHSFLYFFSDDAAIVEILRGGFDGISHPNSIFLSPLLSSILYFLYQKIPSFPWLFSFILVFQSIGLFVGIKILYCMSRNNASRIISISGFIVICNFFFFQISFTSLSLFLWFIGVTSLVWNSFHPNTNVVSFQFIGLLLATSILARPSIFPIAFIISLPGIVFFILKSSTVAKKKLLFVMIPLLAFSFCIGFTEPFYNEVSTKYQKIQKDRSLLIDTPFLKNIPKSTVVQSFPEEDMYILGSWWTHDETIYNHSTMSSFIKQHFDIFKLWNWENGWKEFPFTLFHWIFILLLFFLFQTTSSVPEKRNNNILVSSSTKHESFVISMFVLYILFCNLGLLFIRFPTRISYPFFVFLYIMTYYCSLFPLKKRSVTWIPKSFPVIIIVFMLGGICYLSVVQTNKTQRIAQYNQRIANTMIYHFPANTNFAQIPTLNIAVSPWTRTSFFPHLHLLPEGWMVHSPYYYEHLHSLGIQNGRELCLKMVNNKEYVCFFFVHPKGSFSHFKNNFEKHFTNHYSPLLGNQTVHVEIVHDFRYFNHAGKEEGWVFFYLSTP